jgi:hypothetical protein
MFVHATSNSKMGKSVTFGLASVGSHLYKLINSTVLEKSQDLMSERRTKIICTLGPASSSPDVIRAMMQEGMNVARLNFSKY